MKLWNIVGHIQISDAGLEDETQKLLSNKRFNTEGKVIRTI